MSADANLSVQLQNLKRIGISDCGFTVGRQLVLQSDLTVTRPLKLLEKAHLRAASYWLNDFQDDPDLPQIEKVRGFLETAYHLSKMRAWALLSQLVYAPIFHEQLETCGLYQEQLELYQFLLNQNITDLESLCLDKLGYIHTLLCQYPKAVDYLNRLLKLSVESKNLQLEAKALGGLGLCYSYWGHHQIAMDYCQKHLSQLYQIETLREFNLVSRKEPNSHPWEIADNPYSFHQIQKCRTLATMGFLIYYQKKFRESIYYFKESLAIADVERDSFTQWRVLGLLALTHSQLGKHQEAINLLQVQYQQRHQNYNTQQVTTMLLDLGLVYLYQGQFDSAQPAFQELLDFGQKSANFRAKCYAFMLLGFIDYWNQLEATAINKLQQAITLA